ncbi:AAA family ATPase [Pseudoalteromonas sp. SK20]|uniref:AAA family ATPase n=1 Tax=Pseudoalteromonas sp. SK20 TaxID=1938367 RepID=UPI0009772584|nr:ATP-binding protein [Pseudoalteromonas sp. SK20]
MKINTLSIKGLNNSEIPINITFNDDVNIITGRNGSGKTTILKLMWYCISGNIERAVNEIIFDEVKIETTTYNLTVEKSLSRTKEFVSVHLTDISGEVIFEKKEPAFRDSAVEHANELTIDLLNTSVFFPTFRRIEGGFSMTNTNRHGARKIIRGGEEYIYREHGYGREIQDALEGHAERLSVSDHKFVSSISTNDIQHLVTKQHNKATLEVENYSKTLTNKIFEEIKTYKSLINTDETALKDAVSTLDKINQDVTEFETVRENAFKPITVLSNIIVTIFEHKGIRLNPRVTLGDIDQSINSDSLSAGEKQMLSFLCYNALYSNCPFFIDEPELSLHVDWQRILLDVMIEQKTNNQLFIATHSPFIYTQYEDKEIMIGTDRGDNVE